MRYNSIIYGIFGIIVAAIAISSFVLSYVNLVSAAIDAGIPESIAWLWPITIDLFILLGSLFILVSNLNEEDSWQGWTVLILFTLLSCLFNIAHSPADIMSRAAHAAPPVALCGSLEMLMIRIKRDLLRSTENLEEIREPEPGTVSEKTAKVLSWYTENPDGTKEQARKALGMGWGTVRDIRMELIRTGLIQDRTQ